MDTIMSLPESKTFLKSAYELDTIRKQLSGLFLEDIRIDSGLAASLELILCLANEIAELKEKINEINNK